MDKAEFTKSEYLTLRKEIEESKNRIFQTMGFGLVVVPGSHFLAQAYKLDTVTLSLPVLVVVVALVYMAELNGIMRCGRYIKHHIETQVQGIVGWEAWLETTNSFHTRSVDKYLSYAFYLLFLVYFVGSVFIATRFALTEFGMIITSVLLGGYVAIGIWFLLFLVKNSPVSTSTLQD